MEVPTEHGVRRYPALSAQRIEGLVRHGAIEFYSWSPTADNPTRVRFGRLLLETRSGSEWTALEKGLSGVEDILGGIRSLRVYDGGSGAAIWIPFCDAPEYLEARSWLHAQCLKVEERYPEVATLEPNSHGGPPVHLHVQTNAVGRFSVLPYSVRAEQGYPVAMPAERRAPAEEPLRHGEVYAANFEELMEKGGDLFSKQNDGFWNQRFRECEEALGPQFAAGVSISRVVMPAQRSHGPIVNASIAVLQDGRSHSAEDIFKLAVQCGLLEANTSTKYVYTSLIEYIARANGTGRKPAIVQNADRTFRINEPPDDLPAVVEKPAPPCAPAISALIERLDAAAGQSDEFEQAVCDAFDALGFAATHAGGQKAPDGYADALLGPLSYRTMIECKSGDEGINDPNVFEAAKFRDAYGAEFCALVARAFSNETELVRELQNHSVSAWTIEDVQTLLRIRTGSTTQGAYRGAPAEAPRITEDVAMVLVNQDLAAQGSSATCSRDDVRAAIDYLASPLVGLVQRDPADGSIVVLGSTWT